MKQIFIINPFPIEDEANSLPGVIGGTQSRAITIKSGLKRLGYQSQILSLGYGKRDKYRFGDWRSPEGRKSGYEEIARYIISREDSYVFLLLNRSADIAQQLILFDTLPDDRFKKTLFTTLSEYNSVLSESAVISLRRQRRIVCQQDLTKKWLVKMGVDIEKIEVVSNPVDRNKFSPLTFNRKRQLRISMGIEDSSIVLLYSSRRLVKKGFDTLLDLLEKIENRFVEDKLTFLIAGGNDVNSEGEEMCKRLNMLASKSKNVVTLNIGRTTYQKIDLLYKASDIYLQLSREEGLSNSLLEAIATGLPIIGSDIPENDFATIENFNGLRFRAGDAEDLYEKVIRLCSSSIQMREYGRNSRSLSENFDQERIVKEYLGENPSFKS